MFKHPSASHHWKMQRLSAIGLIPLTLWFIISVASLATADYTVVHQWISTPLTTALLTLLVILASHHTILGMQVVLGDYLKRSTCDKIFASIRLLLIVVALLGLIAIIQINLEKICK